MCGLGDSWRYHGAQHRAWAFGGRQKSGGFSASLASGQLPFDRMFEHALGKALLSIGNFIVKIPSLLGGVTQ